MHQWITQVQLKLPWKQLTLLFLEQYLRHGGNGNAQMKQEFKFC